MLGCAFYGASPRMLGVSTSSNLAFATISQSQHPPMTYMYSQCNTAAARVYHPDKTTLPSSWPRNKTHVSIGKSALLWRRLHEASPWPMAVFTPASSMPYLSRLQRSIAVVANCHHLGTISAWPRCRMSQRHGALSVSSTAPTPLPRLHRRRRALHGTRSPIAKQRVRSLSRLHFPSFDARLPPTAPLQPSFAICTVQEPLPEVSNSSIWPQRITYRPSKKRRFSFQLDFSKRPNIFTRNRESGLAAFRFLLHTCSMSLVLIMIGSLHCPNHLLSAPDEDAHGMCLCSGCHPLFSGCAE